MTRRILISRHKDVRHTPIESPIREPSHDCALLFGLMAEEKSGEIFHIYSGHTSAIRHPSQVPITGLHLQSTRLVNSESFT